MISNAFKLRLPLLLSLLVSLATNALALAPHEILLLVNENSPESLAVANHYIDARKIPDRNVIYLDVPRADKWLTPEEYTESIEQPVLKATIERGLVGQALAWVYSAGFPFKVASKPLSVSITALPMLRGQEIPKQGIIKGGSWRSPIFSGPSSPGGKRGESISLIRLAPILTTNMPPVCISLGYTGERGVTTDEITAMVDRSVISDYRKPDAPVILSTNQTIRSKCRSWIFKTEPENIRKAGRTVEVGHNLYKGSFGGYMGGATAIDTTQLKLSGGAIAEHLTSFGAAFDQKAQMKCSAWIRAGASATAGTVEEPYALWTKFLHARVFEHQANGCTALESMALATCSPLQTYFMGDPLSRPFMDKIAFAPTVTVDEKRELVTFSPNLTNDNPWVILVDGVLITGRLQSPRVSLPFSQMSSGYHTVRIFAFTDTAVRHYSEFVSGFTVPGRKQVTFKEEPAIQGQTDGKRRFRITADGTPKNLRLSQGRRVVGEGELVELDPAVFGSGPIWLWAEADYEESRMRVRSAPVKIEL